MGKENGKILRKCDKTWPDRPGDDTPVAGKQSGAAFSPPHRGVAVPFARVPWVIRR